MSTPRCKHRTLMIGANILLIGGQTSAIPDKFFSAEKWTVAHHGNFDVTTSKLDYKLRKLQYILARWPDVPSSTDGSAFEGLAVDDPMVYSTCAKLPPIPTIQTPTN